jgi:glycosyltransferase involved in cell wall biosynthesis
LRNPIQTYLTKRANLDRHTLIMPNPPKRLQAVIVIPAIAEEKTLPKILDSLKHCDADRLDQTLIIVTINNRPPECIDSEIIQENQRTLDWLRTDPYPALHIAYIDASSPGYELGKKDGVGGARKIGMDHAANCLLKLGSDSPLIICLDADTLIQPNYLDALFTFAKSQNSWAAVIDYAHTIPDDPTQQAAIISYELFLRYQELGMRLANSPYAFHTIGSTIACTPKAYAAVSGMNRRSAGEDFYFLQQLKKTGSITRITSTTVMPSARISWRVPFGTGKRIGRYIDQTHEEYKVYHAEAYRILGAWLTLVSENISDSGPMLIEKSHTIQDQLAIFLAEFGFAEKWDKIHSNTVNPAQQLNQFHCLFNAFQSLKLIHHLRDHGFQNQDTFDAYRNLGFDLSSFPDIENDFPTQLRLLKYLREIMRNGYTPNHP